VHTKFEINIRYQILVSENSKIQNFAPCVESFANIMYSNPNTSLVANPMFLQLVADQTPFKTQLETKKETT
jgi:hypothetical protein